MNRTKSAIVAAFGELLEERPLNKITVKDIVERCGVNRNTFYYHFEGIPSLLEETIEDMVGQVIEKRSRLGSLTDCLAPMLQYMTEHKMAVLHIYRSSQREAFQTGLNRVAHHSVEKYVEKVTACTPSSPERLEERSLLIHYFKCVFVGTILDWLDSRMEYDLLTFISRISELFDGAGRQAFLKCTDTDIK